MRCSVDNLSSCTKEQSEYFLASIWSAAYTLNFVYTSFLPLSYGLIQANVFFRAYFMQEFIYTT